MRTLVEIVSDLEPRLLETLSSIRVVWEPESITASLTFSLMAQGAGRLQRHAVSVDTDDMPAGVSLTAWTRWPDLVVPLAAEPDVETQIRDLDNAGLVGRLDASRFVAEAIAQGLHEPVSWVIKTHAGSDAERREWAIHKHGGKRVGAGRPTVYADALKVCRVTLRQSDIDTLKTLGAGNLSAGIRRAVDERQ